MTARSLSHRLGWFVLIWATSVASLGLVGLLIREALR